MLTVAEMSKMKVLWIEGEACLGEWPELFV